MPAQRDERIIQMGRNDDDSFSDNSCLDASEQASSARMILPRGGLLRGRRSNAAVTVLDFIGPLGARSRRNNCRYGLLGLTFLKYSTSTSPQASVKGRIRGTFAFRVGTRIILYRSPINVVQCEQCDLTCTHSVRRYQKKHSVIPDSMWFGPVNRI